MTDEFDVYYYDGRDMVMEKKGYTQETNAIYLRGPGGVLLKEIRTQDNGTHTFTTKYYYHPDRIGSVLFVTDTKGMVLENEGVSEFGSKAEGIAKHGLTSNMYDKETGLYYFHARWYDASIGRFIEMDPVPAEITMLNMYDYCNNNPVSNTDRYGELFEDVFGVTLKEFWEYGVKGEEPDAGDTGPEESSKSVEYDYSSGGKGSGKGQDRKRENKYISEETKKESLLFEKVELKRKIDIGKLTTGYITGGVGAALVTGGVSLIVFGLSEGPLGAHTLAAGGWWMLAGGIMIGAGIDISRGAVTVEVINDDAK